MSHIERHRTVWISDVHLGSRECRVQLLLDFLRRIRCDTLYLVGDIVDLKSLRRRFFWPPSHTEVLRAILSKAREGTRVVYVPGNHDHDFRALAGTRLGPIELEDRVVHTTAAGKRLLVIHGDEFDGVLDCGLFASLIGCFGYRLLLVLNRANHFLSDLRGRPYWSLAHSVKMRVGKAVRYVARFEHACLKAAREARVDGVVCGHIHKADLVERSGLIYCNDGDWVESCTALTESHQGELSVRHWRSSGTALDADTAVPISEAA
jgi:UDP-2,3-diacylglucosamine pyrophosphatase LpxH